MPEEIIPAVFGRDRPGLAQFARYRGSASCGTYPKARPDLFVREV